MVQTVLAINIVINTRKKFQQSYILLLFIVFYMGM